MNIKNEVLPLKVIKTMQFLFAPYKLEVIFLSCLLFLAGLLETLNLLVLYPLINYGLNQPPSGKILDFFNWIQFFIKTDNLFIFYCYLLLITSIFTVSFRVFCYYVSYKFQKHVITRLFQSVFEKYLTVDYSFFTKNQQGELIHTSTIAASNTTSFMVSQS